MRATLLKRAFAAAVGFVLCVGAAHAAHPASVAGTWLAVGNQTTGGLVLSQTASGAVCKPISGFIFAASNGVRGFYCPPTGRIVFARHTSSGVPFQLYEGQVSRDGAIDRIGGSFMIWNSLGGGAFNEGPDYNFSATK
jgi:hypothetical protein